MLLNRAPSVSAVWRGAFYCSPISFFLGEETVPGLSVNRLCADLATNVIFSVVIYDVGNGLQTWIREQLIVQLFLLRDCLIMGLHFVAFPHGLV